MGSALGPIAIAGAAVNAYGSYQGAMAQSANAAYKAQVAQNNAVTARRKAAMERQAGEISAANSQMKTRTIVGRTLAGQGASGVDVNKGSFVSARKSEAELGMVDALTIRSDAAKRAWADEAAAQSFEAEATLNRATSEQAEDSALVGALGSFLSSVSNSAGPTGKFLMTI